MTARHVIATVLLVAGCGLCVVAVLGVAVMRSTLDRAHYVGVAGFGLLLTAIAVVVQESFSLIADKALLTAALVVVTGPVLVHTTARSSRIRAHGDWRHKIDDYPRGDR